FDSLRPYFERVLAGERVSYERQTNFAGIGLRWTSSIYTPTLNASGHPDGWVAVVLDITDRKQYEEVLRRSEEKLSREANALEKLNALSSVLWSTRRLTEGLEQMLNAAIELMGADKGNIQLFDDERGVLTIAAHRGFDRDFLECFKEVS